MGRVSSSNRPPLPPPLRPRRPGTALLVTAVVGSGIAAQRLSPGDVGLQLLENSHATVLGLGVLILIRPGLRRALQPGRLARGLVAGPTRPAPG